MLTKINGTGGSYAEVKDGKWLVHGTSAALDEAEEDERGFRADLSWDEIKHLPVNTPIYTGVYNFEDGQETTDVYYTVIDFYHYAQEAIRDTYDPEFVNWIDVHHLSFDRIDRIAENLFESLTWQAVESFLPDMEDDIIDNPDIYDHLA